MDHKSCPDCGQELFPEHKFCINCGYKIITSAPITITIKPEGEKSVKNRFVSQFKSISSKAQEVVKRDSSTDVVSKAKELTGKATGIMTPERASEVVGNLVNIMIQVARDVRTQLPQDMINAVDLNAEMSFVAFSVGVSIDLEQITPLQTNIKMEQNED
jgi:hypothetical protein